MSTLYKCGVCGTEKPTEKKMESHVAGSMESNNGDHPHWDELAVEPGNMEAWAFEGPDLWDFM